MTAETLPETKAARTRRRILAVAAHELAQHGYAATTLRQIAAGAGLKLGSLYFHFSTKDELLAEVMRDAVDSSLASIDAAVELLPGRGDARSRLTSAIRVHLAALHESHDRGAAVLGIVGSIPQGAELEAYHHARRYLRAWLPLVEDAQSVGVLPGDLDAVLLRDLLVGALNSTLRSRAASAATLASLADTAVGLLLR